MVLGSFLGCQDRQTSKEVELITAEEMDSLVELGKVQLIDVRTPEEYAEGHIYGAVNINFLDDNFEELIEQVDKSKPVAVYCGKGGRSAKCASYMKKAGFTKIYDLNGGITEWKYKGKDLVQ
ncbi:rhodanese-related sulfurtransferase [Aquimarina brevivitae]|uniref:Rhodanese-related sulfurtransferase n=2 Tax=Aquimarina brevivitae TaxID=323412 RepID=A0A4Q7PHV6_9FLAO|nr:rhodanese-related sulfurtransferase [Aquimarina brevivitae]